MKNFTVGPVHSPACVLEVVIYFPYGRGVSSSSLRRRIGERFEKLRKKADNHLPMDARTQDDADVASAAAKNPNPRKGGPA